VNNTFIQIQAVVFMCPCEKTCRLKSPLDRLTERLRREAQYGRNYDRRRATPSMEPLDAITVFRRCCQQT